MSWKNIKLRGKFIIAFGLVLGLLSLVAVWSISGIGGIVENAGEVIEGNELRTNMNEKYVQHLLWAEKIATLLTDDEKAELRVQTDHFKCKFGQWYYGEGRKRAEDIAPELKPILAKFERPHNELHESAIKIKNVFQQADQSLSAKLREAKSDHLTWAHQVKDYVVNAVQVDRIDVTKDPRICAFGKWYFSDEMTNFKQQHPEFASIAREIEIPHEKLHNSIYTLESYFSQGQIGAAKNYYMSTLKPQTYEVIDVLDKMIAWNDKRVAGMRKANEIYNNETQKKLAEMGKLFNEVITESGNYLMTDQVMLDQASSTRSGVISLSIIALLVGIALAIIIAMGIIRPLTKGMVFAKEISGGNLMAEIDVYQEDEIGELAQAMREMVDKLKSIINSIIAGSENIASASQQMSSSSQQMSQGASEQASSAEEVSSSMEEMASNIQQNTDNANETEKISSKAAEEVSQSNKSVKQTVDSMKNIAQKITIITEIARQTNILALNAAVEAARAGEHGKGFAVVAEEVRKLAARSQEAAKEIEETSRSSVDIAVKSGEMLEAIVPDIQKTARLVQEISAANNEMTGGAEQVNGALQQLNQVTQQNAAASEELATSSEELSSQAEELKTTVSFFSTGSENRSKTKTARKKPPIAKTQSHQTGADKGIALKMDNDDEFHNF
ncbi:MAG: methyl-accepting chemotaxis protein [Salinivirgaceae bacterium]|jgi:methyl-accepting chemotaxis protein|nr:methyl-accepting chemotaxis protein [Salinivirgaceae bacterium]